MIEPYAITPPLITTGSVYRFTTHHGVNYEVRFGRKESNILHANIVFGVTNDEYEGEEYVLTNKNDVYRVMTTIARIVEIYLALHPNTQQFEFTAEDSNLSSREAQKRLLLYSRYIPRVFDKSWRIIKKNDTVIISKKG